MPPAHFLNAPTVQQALSLFPQQALTSVGACFLFVKNTWTAAHTGAALQRNYSVCVGAAALPRPRAPHFHKTVIPRSAATWESVFPMRECSAWRIRFPTPACGLVRNDRALAGAARVGGGVRAPRPTEGYGGAVGAGRRDADPYELDKMPVGRGQCAPPLGVRCVSGGRGRTPPLRMAG